MALKQVPILENAEPKLQAICDKRQAEGKPYSRIHAVADAIDLLLKKEIK